MASTKTLLKVLLFGSAGAQNCAPHTVDFIMTDGIETLLQIEDDITKDLAKIGVTVNRRVMDKDAFNTAMVAGDFHMAFSETWGPPYDPHSFAGSWSAPDEAYYAALKGLPAPNTYDVLMGKINDVLSAPESTRDESWAEILNILHDAATELPLSGKRIPAVINNRLHGYKQGLQQFDYPLHTLRVGSGSTTINVAPAGQGGLFAGVGRLDPHSYRPNEFFANNLVYEGLVEYGENGVILPSLAESWTIEDRDDQDAGQVYTFTLRQGVKFHDGSDWDCSVAKLNFDHVFTPPLTTGDWHGWYGVPAQAESWSCVSDFVFEIKTKTNYYPFLQELSFIRPMRMLSPAMFVGGAASDPLTQNSCPTGWVNATLGDVTATCAGTLGISGTGRWAYDSTEDDGTVVFNLHADHWDGSPADAAQVMRLVMYADNAAVKSAMMDGSLDVVVGEGVLDPEDIADMMANHHDKVHVSLTDPIMTRIMIFNTAKAPTDSIQLRKAMIHAIDKPAIVAKELHGLADPVDGLFPKTAPYCNLDLTPRWDYDFEKAQLLNCPSAAVAQATADAEAKAAIEKQEALAAAAAAAEADAEKAAADAEKAAAAAKADAEKAAADAEKAAADAEKAAAAAKETQDETQAKLDQAVADKAETQAKLDEALEDLKAAEESGALAGVLGLTMFVAGRL
jgi:ABC-type transport system substrate-binding protein